VSEEAQPQSIDHSVRRLDRKLLIFVGVSSLLACFFWPAFAVSLPASVISVFVVSSTPRFVRVICICAAIPNVAVAIGVALYYWRG
jgi:uncharacterized membrane protein